MPIDFFQTVGGQRFISKFESFIDDCRKAHRQHGHVDWETFRAVAAKDILCATRNGQTTINRQTLYEVVSVADELIDVLKETSK